MTEKAFEERKAKIFQGRKHKLAQLTTMAKQFEELMEDDANVDIVKNKLRVDYKYQKEFADINSDLQCFMSEEEILEDQKNWFDSKNKTVNEFYWKCEGWMRDVLKRAVDAEEVDKCVAPNDSRSASSRKSSKHKSMSSSQSGSSNSSSAS